MLKNSDFAGITSLVIVEELEEFTVKLVLFLFLLLLLFW